MGLGGGSQPHAPVGRPMYTYENIPSEFFPECEIFQIKLVEKIKNYILCPIIPPPPAKIVSFMR